jgi:hypothetical protein
MHYPISLSILFLSVEGVLGTIHNSPRAGILKRDTQLSCGTERSNPFDALCVADDGTGICAERLDTCCQLPDGKTPYTCGGFDNSHCCGTTEPACGAHPSCKSIRGDIDVVSAQSAISPTTIEVTVAPTKTTQAGYFDFATATGTLEAPVVQLVTMTAQKNPNATGGARTLNAGINEEGAIMVLAAVMALI